MKTRLGIFIAALLLLPLAGLQLSGTHWSDLAAESPTYGDSVHAALRTSLTLMIYILVANQVIKRLTGKAPLDFQRSYFIGVSIASAGMGWQLSYLNLFVASWSIQQGTPTFVQVMLYTPAFALLAPAILITRSFFGSFAALVKAMTCRLTFPAPNEKALALILLTAALLGLIGGAAWPANLFWLFWASPLFLLMSLQLLWHENTIFTSVRSGDWSRVVCASLSGVVVGNFTVASYQSNASLEINLPSMLIAQLALALFGLLCLQLGDVISENWRDHAQTARFEQAKNTPIHAITNKK